MGGQGSGRPPKPETLVKRWSEQTKPTTAVSNALVLPNLSGDHSAGQVLTTPVNANDIVNKAYCDSNATPPAGSDGQIQYNNSGAFGANANLKTNKSGDIEATNLKVNDATTGGADNTFLGIGIGASNTGARNMVMGKGAGAGLTTGSDNVFIGKDCAAAMDTAGSNTAIGTDSMRYGDRGTYNFGLGKSTLYWNVYGSHNIAIGNQAGFGTATKACYYDIFIGADSGYYVQNGGYNICIGGKCANKLTTANFNTLIGYQADEKITTGSNNVMIGYNAGQNNQTGASNVFIGNNAGQNETTSNKLYIANTNTANPLIYGEFDNNFVKINSCLCLGQLIDDSAPNDSLFLSGSSLYHRDNGGTDHVVT